VGRKLCKLPEEVTISTLQSSLSLRLWSGDQRERKDYIHNHPVKAGLCRLPEDYKYSSARFYERNEKDWVFLTHHDGWGQHACWWSHRSFLRATPTRARILFLQCNAN